MIENLTLEQFFTVVVPCVIIAALAPVVYSFVRDWMSRRAPVDGVQVRDISISRPITHKQPESVPAPQREALPTIELPKIATALNVAIIGPKDSGKTTTMRALLALRPGYVEALDPHSEPGKWPCAVVGGGLNFDAVLARLITAESTMRGRYQASHRGEQSQESYRTTAWRFALAGDEWGNIVKAIPPQRASKDRAATPGAGQLLASLLTQSRKVGIGMLIAAHDDTAAQFGLGGEMGLVDCFDYLVYLGGQATGNTSIPSDVRAAARRMRRPAVALNTELHEWCLVSLDNIHHYDRPSLGTVAAPDDYAKAIENVSTPAADRFLAELDRSWSQPQPQPQPPGNRPIEAAEGAVEGSTSASTALDEATTWADVVAWTCPDNGLTATRGQVLDLLRAAKTEPEIVKTLWAIDGTKGARYRTALEIVATIRAEVLSYK